MDFLEAVSRKGLFTENGMPTHSSSGSYLVDLFFKMGASRQVPEKDLENLFLAACAEDLEIAVRCMFYNRDIRGGQGERRSFRIFLRTLLEYFPELAETVIPLVPEYGRWDDLFVLYQTPSWEYAKDFILFTIKEGKNNLVFKWMPREGKSHDEIAQDFMESWELSPRNYRLLLSQNTSVVETKMCQGLWGEIKYPQVPSQAMRRYRKAFGKHDTERFGKYLEDVKYGKEKINAGAVFPHEIMRPYLGYGQKEDTVLEEMWKAQPNYVPVGFNFLPVCDVSGSMAGLPMEVSIALGIYLSERNSSFPDAFITFSGHPELQTLKSASLWGKVQQLREAAWSMNTNIQAVFELVLTRAVEYKLRQEQMPRAIIILSDMQFDEAIGNKKHTRSAYELILGMYKKAGYKPPMLIFWNLRDSIGVPVKITDTNTLLVSGFSPSIMRFILNGGDNPLSLVMSVVNSPRYNISL